MDLNFDFGKPLFPLTNIIISDDARKLVGWMPRAIVMTWWPEQKKKDYQGWPMWTNQEPSNG